MSVVGRANNYVITLLYVSIFLLFLVFFHSMLCMYVTSVFLVIFTVFSCLFGFLIEYVGFKYLHSLQGMNTSWFFLIES